MKQILRLLMPLAVLGGSVAIGFYLLQTAPEPKRRPHNQAAPMVEVLEVQPGSYTVKVKSRGTVTPRTKSTLVSEVAGRIVEASSNFRNGGFFGAREILLSIDPAEYKLAAANIDAELKGVEARLSELELTAENLKMSIDIESRHLELAKKQYRRNGELHKDGTVAKFVMEQSEQEYLTRNASLQSLKNSLNLVPAQRQTLEAERNLKLVQRETAQLDLARTRILAPYAGRILEKQADLGQSVSKGSSLATIYAVDFAEVRLPITDRQSVFLDLPENFREESTPISSELPVTLFPVMGGKKDQWQGRIVRTEGTIDTQTRQLFVVAQVDDPYGRQSDGKSPLKVGQFVEAEIQGRTLSGVFVLPRKAVRANDEIFLVTPESRIHRKRVEVAWRDEEHVIVTSGLQPGDRLSLTALPYAPDEAPVTIKETAIIIKSVARVNREN